MRIKILIFLGIFCFLALSTGGCVGGQQKPLGFSGVTAYDGILYLGSTDGKVMAVNPSARNQEMSFPSSEGEWYFAITMLSRSIISCGPSSVPVNIYGTPTVVGESVCIGSYNGKVLMMSPSARSQNLPFPQTRSGEWTYPRTEDVIEPIVGSPVVADDTVYVCSSDGRVYALDMTYGDEKWKSDPLGDKLWITPVVKEETVYVSTFDGHIYALSAKDGSLSWAFKAEAGFVSSPVLYENVIFVGSFDRNLYAVRVGDNEPLWKFLGGNWFWAAPVVANGVVYAGCLDGKVYAIDSKAGNELWEFDAGSPIVSSPALADDLLVVACDSGKVYALDIFKGEPINEVSIDAPVRASLCIQEGIVYIRAQDNCLYAVDVGKGKTNWRFPLTIK